MESRSTFICVTHPTRAGFVEQMLPEEIAAMQAHVAYFERLASQSNFFLFGPCRDRAFGIAIFDAESDEAARELLVDDPALKAGVLTHEVHPFYVHKLILDHQEQR